MKTFQRVCLLLVGTACSALTLYFLITLPKAIIGLAGDGHGYLAFFTASGAVAMICLLVVISMFCFSTLMPIERRRAFRNSWMSIPVIIGVLALVGFFCGLWWSDANQRPFSNLAWEGPLADVRSMLADGADPNAQDALGKTPLMYTAGEGLYGHVRLLLEHGADIDQQDDRGLTALMLAAWQGRTECVVLLLDHGATIDRRDRYGLTALMHSSIEGHTHTVSTLLERGADIDTRDDNGKTALIYASENKRTDTVKLLVERGAKE